MNDLRSFRKLLVVTVAAVVVLLSPPVRLAHADTCSSGCPPSICANPFNCLATCCIRIGGQGTRICFHHVGEHTVPCFKFDQSCNWCQ
jgi:hypothetical protein